MKKALALLFALIASVGMAWADKTVYLDPGSFENGGTHSWDEAGAVVEAWVWSDTKAGRWVSPSSKIMVSGTTYYCFVVDDDYNKAVFNRAETVAKAHDNQQWAQIAPGDNGHTFANNTLYTITDWNSYSTGTFTGDPYSGATKKTIYLWPTSAWEADGAVFSVYAYTDGNNNCWIPFSALEGASVCYVAEVPTNCANMIFVRGDGSKAPTMTFDNRWNQTQNSISISGTADNTIFKITAIGSGNNNSTFTTTDNLALLGTATASFAEGGNVATYANNGNTEDRWGSNGGTDTEWCQIAWSSNQTFNTIKLLCENAMNVGFAPNLAFDIQVSDNGTDWISKKHVWGKNAGNNEYITVVLNEPATAKFVRFQGVKKGTYGYTFFEFEVYNTDYSAKTLNRIELSSYRFYAPSGTAVALSAIGKTSENEEIPTGSITWNVAGGTGNVANETFTPTTNGTFSINTTSPKISNSTTIDIGSTPSGTAYTNDTHTIYVLPRHYTNTFDYELIVTSTTDDMVNFSGSYWNINGVSTPLNSGNLSVSADGRTMILSVKSTSAPTMNTPLYINMPTEVSFTNSGSNPTYNWVEVASGKTYDVMVNDDKAAVAGTISSSNLSDIQTLVGNSSIINISNATIDGSIDVFTTNNANAIFEYGNSEAAAAATKTVNNVFYSDVRFFGAPNGLTFVDDPANVPLLPTKAYCNIDFESGKKVVISRSIAANKYVTTYMGSNAGGAMAATLETGLVAYELTAAEAGQLTFTRVNGNTISAGKGYVIHNTTSGALTLTWQTNAEQVYLDEANQNEANVEAVDGVKILGTLQTLTTDGNQWILSGNQIKKGNGAKISPYRAYFTGVTVSGSSSAIAIFDEGNGTTTIRSINANGEIDNVFYDLSGRRVENPTKGIYIMNGKKVVIK